MWHCPHCGAPQAETARCWVCRRSSTTCSTCRHFRASLAADVGYCALDRRRRPLTGLELRGCWEQRPSTAEGPAGATDVTTPHGATDHRGSAPPRGFVPIDDVGPLPIPDPLVPAPTFLLGDSVDGWETRTSLFGEPER